MHPTNESHASIARSKEMNSDPFGRVASSGEVREASERLGPGKNVRLAGKTDRKEKVYAIYCSMRFCTLVTWTVVSVLLFARVY